MNTVKEHYDRVLADVYSWMFGGFNCGIQKNQEFFAKHNISPLGSGIAVDLGAGCGFQSIPLARVGFLVTAIDLNQKLLNELQKNSGSSIVKTIQDDLMNFDQHLDRKPELVVCMTDTIVHLESQTKVISLLEKVFSVLENNGKLIVTFRDLSQELSELNRFIPIKSDDNIIFTCFLEYEPHTVKVHDLVYYRDGNGWQLNKSYYRKLRLSQSWMEEQLNNTGFNLVDVQSDRGLITAIATKQTTSVL